MAFPDGSEIHLTKKRPKWKKAEQLCTEALAGRASPEEARMAFEAAKEEGMLRPSV
ncbi:MAG: DUF982 domain-containing protein [Mesorhizobium sp.]|nr:MAG: DUF982 domain-containing protein [Mesorhizobium sp.]TKC02251.1 MAG: DUF982 domain-containing protein [Mesorhizobium sp.]